MKFGVFTVMLPELSPEEAVTELAAAGYDGVEWRVRDTPAEQRAGAPSFWANNLATFPLDPEEAPRARALADSAGLTIPSLGTYTQVTDTDEVAKAMRFAQAAGAPQLRVTMSKLDAGYHEVFDRARRALRQVEAMARDHGLRVLVETHQDTITPSASLAHRLVSDFDPEVVGVLYDCGNLVVEGYEDYRIGTQLLGPYLHHVHVKNGAWRRPDGGGQWTRGWAPLDDGIVDFPAFFAALAEVGYDDWVVIEDFSGARPTRETLRFDLEFLRRHADTAVAGSAKAP